MRCQFNKLVLFLLPVLILAGCGGFDNSQNISEQTQQVQQYSTASAKEFNYQTYSSILTEYVNKQGLVDYKKLKENRQKLDEFNGAIGAVKPSEYNSWTDAEKIAFLINAYNSLTLEAIIDNYPTKSIRNIPGVWKIRRFDFVGNKFSLDHIEHQILRKEFDRPGIHVALVCAAISCPLLRTEPYTGEKLVSQLDDQARKFIGNNQNFRIDRQENTVYLSSIFKWFGEDFEKSYAKDRNLEGLKQKETAVINYISKYVNSDDMKYLEQGGYQVKYLDYDWSLNAQS